MDKKRLEQVRELKEKGLKQKDIAKQLGISLPTVQRAFAELRKMALVVAPSQAVQNELSEEKIRAIIREELESSTKFPVLLKNGKGEMLAPEAMYYELVSSDGLDGKRDFKALMKWFAAIEMVHRLTEVRKGEAEAFAASVKPVLDMMERSRQELDAAAARARESSMEIAQAAAMGAAGGVLGRVDARFDELKQQKPDIATVQDPMKGLMARTMEAMWNRMAGMLFGGGASGQVPPSPGLVDKRVQQ